MYEVILGASQNAVQGKPVPEHEDPYPSSMKGMEELRSPAAIPALIHSLQPSEAKTEVVKKCLARYRLTTLPIEPGSPGRLCDPDVFARQYLGNLTGIKEDHPHDWWSRWWSENGAKLRWSPELGSFKLPAEPQ